MERHSGEERETKRGEEWEGKGGKQVGDDRRQERQDFKEPSVGVEVKCRPDRIRDGPLPRPNAREPEHAQRRFGGLVVLVGGEGGEG